MKRAVIYTRMSSVEQEDSPERQLNQTIPYCEKRGYRLVGKYQDLAMRGDDDSRPDFQRLLRDADASKFDVIVVDEASRLSRSDNISFDHFVAFPLRASGVTIDSVAKGIHDWDDFSHGILQYVNQHTASGEVITLSRRIVTKLAVQALKGEAVAGKAAYGYRTAWVNAVGETVCIGKRNWTDHRPDGIRPTLIIHEEEAEVVRWIYSEYASGETSLNGIMKLLRDRGISSPRGHAYWSRASLRELLTKRCYLGDYVFNQQTVGRYHKLSFSDKQGTAEPKKRVAKKENAAKVILVDNPESDWVIRTDHHPAIITRETFQQVQAALKDNQERRTPNPGRNDYVLAKLLVCSHCGSWMTGDLCSSSRRVGHKELRVYNCGGYSQYGPKFCRPHRIREDVALKLIEDVVKKHFFNPELLDGLRAKAREEAKSLKTGETISRLRKETKSLETKIARATSNLLLLDPSLVPGAQTQVRSWEQERAVKAGELARLQTESPVEDTERLIKHIERWMGVLADAMKVGDRKALRAALRQSVLKVELRFRQEPKAKITRYHLEGGVAHLHSGQQVAIDAMLAPASAFTDLSTTGRGSNHLGKSLAVPFNVT